jgi:hypothetical protein
MGKASNEPAAASAAVTAQLMDEKASANVAVREEIWRRRKSPRRVWLRNQSWIATAQAELPQRRRAA